MMIGDVEAFPIGAADHILLGSDNIAKAIQELRFRVVFCFWETQSYQSIQRPVPNRRFCSMSFAILSFEPE
jgi:hypothetical protein